MLIFDSSVGTGTEKCRSILIGPIATAAYRLAVGVPHLLSNAYWRYLYSDVKNCLSMKLTTRPSLAHTWSTAWLLLLLLLLLSLFVHFSIVSFSNYALYMYLVNGKAIPLQAWTGPEGSRTLRLPDFKTIGT
jgi:hypothetical protein